MPQFDESKHPRAEDGKFTSKEGGSTATSKKEKEYNPRGSSLKAGDSISYKEDTAYGGERRKGKIARIDGDTITTTDGKKINMFNAFKDEDEDEWGKWADKTDKEVPSNWKPDGFDGDTRFYNVENKGGLQIDSASVSPDGVTTLYTENASLSFESLKEATDFLSITDKKEALKTLQDRGWLGETEEEAVNDMFKNNTKPLQYSRDYDGLDKEFNVATPQETANLMGKEVEDNGKIYKPENKKAISNDEVDLDYERSYGVIPDPEEEPKEYKKYMDTYKKWKENGGSFETPEQNHSFELNQTYSKPDGSWIKVEEINGDKIKLLESNGIDSMKYTNTTKSELIKRINDEKYAQEKERMLETEEYTINRYKYDWTKTPEEKEAWDNLTGKEQLAIASISEDFDREDIENLYNALIKYKERLKK